MMHMKKAKEKFDPKAKAIDELFEYLDGREIEDFKSELEPKEGVSVTKVEAIGDEETPMGEESLEVADTEMGEEGLGEELGSDMTPEELEELMEALKAKLA